MSIQTDTAITVYGLKAFFSEQKGTIRDIRTVWALEELGKTYRLEILDGKKGEHKSEDFLKMNPFGKVPTIKDGDFTLFESSAICTYIGDKYKRLTPIPGTLERAKYDQWLSVVMTMIEPHTSRIFACDYFFEQDEQTRYLKGFAYEVLANFLPVMEQHLITNKYLMGSNFSMADITLTGALNMIKHTQILNAYPQLQNYLRANQDRPAYQKAFALNAPMD